MKIIFVDTLGLPYDGDTLQRRGLGGSESAVIHMSKHLASLGNDVTVYNDCQSDDCNPGAYDQVNYQPLSTIEHISEPFDVMVASRSCASLCPAENDWNIFQHQDRLPNFTNAQRFAQHKVLWMHDTFCDGDNLIEPLYNLGHINEVFTLSDWHTTYVSTCIHHGIVRDPAILKNAFWQTRNGINVIPESDVYLHEKVDKSFVYNASATKGLVPLIEKIWPRIYEQHPDAQLTVIGGYYKFRDDSEPDEQQLTVNRLIASEPPGVTFTGVIKQSEISQILRTTQFMLYPSAFPETFGISTLEALAHNVPVITCVRGALEQVAIEDACYKIRYPITPDFMNDNWLNEDEQVEHFVNMTLNAIDNNYIWQQKFNACNKVKRVTDWKDIAKEWNYHFIRKTGQYTSPRVAIEAMNINYNVADVYGHRFRDPEMAALPLLNRGVSDVDRIGIIVCAYNAEQWIEKCLTSIGNQIYSYDDYKLFIVDDASDDDTLKVINDTLKGPLRNGIPEYEIISNSTRNGALANQLTVAKVYTESEHIDKWFFIDGDDYLGNDPFILEKYVREMGDCKIGYGSMWSLADNIPLHAQQYPADRFQSRDFRGYRFPWIMPYTHLRCFDSEVLLNIDVEQLINSKGEFYKAGGDLALMYAALDQCKDPSDVYVNPNVVYHYRDNLPTNDFRENPEEQDANKADILGDEY